MNIFNKLNFILNFKQKKNFFILVFFILIGMGLEMIGVGIIVPVLDSILDSENSQNAIVKQLISIVGPKSNLELVFYFLFIMILISIVKMIYLISLSYFKFKYTANVEKDIAKRLYKGYLFSPYSYHLKINTSHMLRNLQLEVAQFNSSFQAVIGLITEITVIIGMIVILFLYEPYGALTISVILIFASILFQRIIKTRLVKWGKERQSLDGDINKVLLQSLNGIKDVKLYEKELFFYNIFDKKIISKINFQTKYVTIKHVPRQYLEFLGMSGLVLLIYILYLQNVLPANILSTLAVFAAASFKMIPSFNIAMSSIQVLRYSEASVNILYNDISEVLKREENKVKSNNEPLSFNDSIKFQNAFFRFENSHSNLFSNFSLQINKGSVIGFIGKSGSGKSTLADLLMGLLDLDYGQIMVDDKDIQSNIKSWQSKVGYVPQSIYLTDDTIASNIAFGSNKNEFDKRLLDKAIRDAQLDEFINSLEFGVESNVGEAGTKLSGGQRQRIGIARALYRNPKILIFDEATSALDNETEKAIMDSIYKIKNKTILIIAHRLSTIERCDYIYKFDKGIIVEEGEPSKILINK
jgi:ATP-binding cassette, subfamily B, bacterial PglK